MKSLHTDLQSFIQLHDYLQNIDSEELNEWIYKAEANNPWFTAQNVKSALEGIIEMLEPKTLEKFFLAYKITSVPKKIGVIMAGNIPAVGFHDLLCVLLSGNILFAKLSTDDSVLLKKIAAVLIKFNPSLETRINFVEQLKNMDAYIATGSDNTAKHFEYYFRNTPNIIRKNRTSVAFLNGDETTEDLLNLGADVFQYFGLGCRNVSHLYLPKDYSPVTILSAWENQFEAVRNHHKYMNNYEYNKAILLIDQVHHFDSGYLLLKESDSIFSHIATLTYSYYDSQEALVNVFETNKEQLQCIVSSKKINLYPTYLLGQAQHPAVNDFADGVDTMAFLTAL